VENLTQRLKKFRQEHNFTQEQFGKQLDINKQIYNNIEKNRRTLHLDELIKLKNRFNVNPNWLLTGEGEVLYTSEKDFQLIELILDYREYGGEIDYVLERILVKILDKFYKRKYILKVIPRMKYANRLHYVLMYILKQSSFNGKMTEAKKYFLNEVEKFHWQNYRFVEKIKKEIYVMSENLTDKDCYYLLKHKGIAMRIILNKIPPLDQKINGLLVAEEDSSNFLLYQY